MKREIDSASYGPGLPNEGDLRLIGGDLRNKRVLALGCTYGSAWLSFARASAQTIAVDPSPDAVGRARELAESEGLRVELRANDLADLAFLRAESIDLAFSAHGLAYVENLGRVLRQVHRSMRRGSPLVFSLPHPFAQTLSETESGHVVTRSYFEPEQWVAAGKEPLSLPYLRSIGEVIAELGKAGFRVEAVAEPESPPQGADQAAALGSAGIALSPLVPAGVVFRARKEGN